MTVNFPVYSGTFNPTMMVAEQTAAAPAAVLDALIYETLNVKRLLDEEEISY